MNASQNLVRLLTVNMFVDFLFRVNFVIFIIIAAIQSHTFLYTLLVFLYVPRFFHVIVIAKLLFLDKYNPYNRSLLNLSYLLRSNFIEEDILVNDQLHPYKRSSPYQIVRNIRSVLLMILPSEIGYFIFDIKTKKQR